MLLLTATTDKIQLVTSAATNVDVHASFVDASNANPPVIQGDSMGRLNTAISTATTTDIVVAPGSGDVRNVKMLSIRNKSTSTSNDVSVVFDQNGTDFELVKVTLPAGATLEFVEGVGFYVLANVNKLDVKLRVTTDQSLNSTTAWTNVTDLTYPLESDKHYGFHATIYHIENASTTGFRLGVNGPTATAMRVGGETIFAGSLTAATQASALSDVAAYDTSVTGATTSSAGTPQVVPASISGWINTSAAGTFAIRVQSEISVASGVIVKAGSWLNLWEFDN